MASTIAIYTGDGTTTDFTVPFDYLAKKFVKVSVGLTVLKGGDYGDTSKDYYFLDKTTVRLKTAPQAGADVTIRRYTSATDRIVSFKDASILKATDLDTASIQTIHIAEEGRDVINDALIVDKYGNWDAKGHRIVNVGDPVDDSDAVNFKTYKADAMGAHQSRVEADKARDRAVEAETNAKESETNAKVSEDIAVSASEHADAVKTENQAILEEARQIQNSVETSERNAYDNAVNATKKADEAKVSEVNAKASEVEAKKQADLAKGYAEDSASGQLNADWEVTDSKSKAFIKNKPMLGALAYKDSVAYSEITGTPPEQDLSGLATKDELQTGLAGKEDTGVCIPLDGHINIPGKFAFANRDPISKTTDNDIITISGGTDWSRGAQVILEGINYSNTGGGAELVARKPDGSGISLKVSPDGFSYLDNKKVAVVHSCGGNWIRLTNGLQIVFVRFSFRKNSGAEVVNFPVPFKTAPSVQANCWFGSDSETPNISSSDFSNVTNTTCSVRVRTISSDRIGYDCTCFVLAVGYWL